MEKGTKLLGSYEVLERRLNPNLLTKRDKGGEIFGIEIAPFLPEKDFLSLSCKHNYFLTFESFKKELENFICHKCFEAKKWNFKEKMILIIKDFSLGRFGKELEAGKLAISKEPFYEIWIDSLKLF